LVIRIGTQEIIKVLSFHLNILLDQSGKLILVMELIEQILILED